MVEKILPFGKNKSLFGIATMPTAGLSTAPKYCVILLNSGLIHRVGPHRLNVEIARHLSRLGMLVFRFDLPGIGDSLKEKVLNNYQESVIDVISSAMDAVTAQFQVNKFISLGNCSGAMNSHLIASADERICGAALMDAYTYPTPKYWVLRIKEKLSKLFQATSIKALITRSFNGVSNNKNVKSSAESALNDVNYWHLPLKSKIKQDLTTLMNRDVNLLYVYTGGLTYYYNHEEQHRSAFRKVRFKDNLELHYLEKIDHTYTLDRDKQVLFEILTGWIAAFE